MFMTDELLKQKIKLVNQAFYDRIYQDPWLGQIFQSVGQEHIENQQTDFMLGALGGPKRYGGRNPRDAHPHIFVDQAMWDLREKYLIEAFEETNFPTDLREKWLKIDAAFKSAIIKNNLGECKKRFNTDEIIFYPAGQFKKTG